MQRELHGLLACCRASARACHWRRGESLAQLGAAAGRLQHAEAKTLYDEGLTMEQIGRLFGVTHQRVSAMLNRAGAENW